jgi:hypothetical protein
VSWLGWLEFTKYGYHYSLLNNQNILTRADKEHSLGHSSLPRYYSSSKHGIWVGEVVSKLTKSELPISRIRKKRARLIGGALIEGWLSFIHWVVESSPELGLMGSGFLFNSSWALSFYSPKHSRSLGMIVVRAKGGSWAVSSAASREVFYSKEVRSSISIS